MGAFSLHQELVKYQEGDWYALFEGTPLGLADMDGPAITTLLHGMCASCRSIAS
jgi:hypothetical protein